MFYHQMSFPLELDGNGFQGLIRYAVGRDKISIHYVKLDIAGKIFGLPDHTVEGFRLASKDSRDYPSYSSHWVIVRVERSKCQNGRLAIS